MDLYVAAIGWSARRLDPKSKIHDGASFRAASVTDKAMARNRMFEQPSLIDEYVAINPDQLGPEDLALVQSWRSFVRDNLIVERDLQRYTVFLDYEDPPVAYAVLSLLEEVVDVLPPPLPKLVEAVLLPWRGAIVCDGILRYQNVIFAPSIRRRMKDAYSIAKARGLITRLGEDPPATPTPKKSKQSIRQPDAKKPFVGKWRIVEMDAWDADYFEMDGPAFIEIEKNGLGYLKFGLVEGEIDCRFSFEAGLPTVEFSWNGFDENDPACGRGRASIDAGKLRGRIFIHVSSDSEFVATCAARRPLGRRRDRGRI